MSFDPKILVLSGSTRSGSLNTRLAGAVTRDLALADARVMQISLSDYELPIYDGDLEANSGPPENARRLSEIVRAHSGLFVASPEYNGGLTPLLKNAIDWISRVRDKEAPGGGQAFAGKVVCLGAASPGAFGGARGLMHLHQVLSVLGALVLPGQVTLPSAAQAFGDNDAIINERAREIMATSLEAFLGLVRRTT